MNEWNMPECTVCGRPTRFKVDDVPVCKEGHPETDEVTIVVLDLEPVETEEPTDDEPAGTDDALPGEPTTTVDDQSAHPSDEPPGNVSPFPSAPVPDGDGFTS